MKIKEKCELVTVNAGENLKKLRSRNFVRPTKHSILLPYFDELDKELDKNLEQILNGLFTCFATENPYEGPEYCDNLNMYLNHFGLRMSKKTFLDLIRFFYEIFCRENLQFDLLTCASSVFRKLMKLSEPLKLSWRDLTLDWRPLFHILDKSFRGKIRPNPFDILNSTIYMLAIFFHPKEQAAIWEKCLQFYNYGDQTATSIFTSFCWNFLCIEGMSEEEVKQYAVDVWLKNLWEMYVDAEMNTAWTIVCVDYISELVKHAPGAMDITPFLDTIYTKLMRGFLLTARSGRVFVGDGQENLTVSRLATVVVYSIGGPHSSLSHFQRLMQYISFHVHPQNSGAHDTTIDEFMDKVVGLVQDRIEKERLAYVKRAVPKEYYLTDGDIDAVTEALIESAIMMMYAPDNFPSCYKTMFGLNALNRELVSPKILDHFYTSISAISEPQRLSILISAFSKTIFETIRSPGPEYRAPRDITYDSHWLKVMEEQRKEWPTYELGSELPQVATHRFTSLRAHAFYIMEILVNQINMNDVDRTAAVLKTLVVLFSSFPLMDFSAGIQFHGAEMSEDDKMLCILSKRVPNIVQFAFKRILDVITCFSVSPPKVSSATAGASMSSESQQCEGDDEAMLKNEVQKCIMTIFERVDAKIRSALYSTLWDYLNTVEFATYLASNLLATVVSAAVWRSGSEYQRLAKLLLTRLKNLLTEEVQKCSNAPSTVVFNAVLSRFVYAVPHNVILENEKLICEITDLLLTSECKIVHRAATHGINLILCTVLHPETESVESPENLTFAKPLSEWNPIKEWARCNDYTETVIKWYIPGKPEIDFAQRIANRYLFPVIEQLQPGKLDREHLRRAIDHLSVVLNTLREFRRPDTYPQVPDVYTPYCLPIARYELGNTCTLEFDLKGPNGENTQELLVAMVERMIGSTQDPTALIGLHVILSTCHGKTFTTDPAPDLEKSLDRAHQVLRDATYSSFRKASQHTMDELAFYKHTAVLYYHRSQIHQPTTFDQRVFRLVTELALNDYEKVRDYALNRMLFNIDHMYRCRDMIIPQVIAVLTDDQSKNTDRLAGAMQLLLELGYIDSQNPKFRLVLWDALLRIKVHDDFKICVLFDKISFRIKSVDPNPVLRQGDPEKFHENNRKMVDAGSRLINSTDVWAPFLTEESIRKQSAVWQEFEQLRHVLRVKLVDLLFERHIGNKALHHTREKLARAMAFGIQREASDEKTIRLLLSQLVDEDCDSRKDARLWLFLWLKRNKPKSVRVDITPPARADHGNSMESGIREDNLWIMYDSENLPDTEEKWNETTFLEREQGTCRWPSTISVVRKRKDGPPLETKPRTACDKAIIEFFSNETLVNSLFLYRNIEKDANEQLYETFYGIVKYIVRNYSDDPKPLELFIGHLMRLIKSDRKNDQNLAAELFYGIVIGLKHHPFAVLNEFWKNLLPRLDKFFYTMLDEAMDQWSTALASSFGNSDLRRRWWLVESLIEGARKSSSSSECQQAFRLSNLMSTKWRNGEIMSRMCKIAWNKLGFVLTDSLRFVIARVFIDATLIRESNKKATLVNIPERFIPNTVDEMIERMISKVPQLTVGKQHAQTSASNSALPTPKKRKAPITPSNTGSESSPAAKRQRRTLSMSSPSSCAETRTNMTYFRTLLEFVLQYYENAMHAYTPCLIRIIPKLMEYANEDDLVLSEETYRDVDISQNASIIVHDYMSGAWINENYVNEIVKSLQTTYENNMETQRVRLAVVKFIQACVYSNMYLMNRGSRQKQVEQLLLQAVMDKSIVVRREAAKCLLLLIHCDCIHLTDAQIDGLAQDLDWDVHNPGKKSNCAIEARIHGAALLLGALSLAFPFTLPVEKILKPLRILSATSTKRALVRRSVTETMREFRRQHRDDWQKTKIALGAQLAFDIENAIAPAYYA